MHKPRPHPGPSLEAFVLRVGTGASAGSRFFRIASAGKLKPLVLAAAYSFPSSQNLSGSASSGETLHDLGLLSKEYTQAADRAIAAFLNQLREIARVAEVTLISNRLSTASVDRPVIPIQCLRVGFVR